MKKIIKKKKNDKLINNISEKSNIQLMTEINNLNSNNLIEKNKKTQEEKETELINKNEENN